MDRIFNLHFWGRKLNVLSHNEFVGLGVASFNLVNDLVCNFSLTRHLGVN